tara:strand:- start:304 stop:1257 length:954 start_codon:yes stop_codon:yes gene_type:complete
MINKNTRAFICGIKGKSLSNNEKKFLVKYKPWGIILFSRNIDTIKQTQELTKSIKKLFKNYNYPILIDEEGGRVSRLKKFIDNSIFTAKFFGDMSKNNPKKFSIYFNIYVKQIGHLLKILGININTVPILDIRRKNSHKIIGDRSYSTNKKIVKKVGEICIKNFHKNKIGTVIKHIPGHGLAKVDSHKKLPVINKNLNYLIKNDFSTFKNNKSLLGMTGHLLFKKIDNLNISTHSKKIIDIVRNKIQFKNIIITDDLSMKAIKKDLKTNVLASFNAGCNIVLHCNGNLKEMLIVAKNSPKIDNFILKKTSQLISIIG